MISFTFRLIYGRRVLQTGLKIGESDCLQMSETSELPGADLWTPARGVAPGPHQGPYGGPLDPTPIYALTFFSTPTSKNVPRALHNVYLIMEVAPHKSTDL